MSSVICFNLDQCKILSSGQRLSQFSAYNDLFDTMHHGDALNPFLVEHDTSYIALTLHPSDILQYPTGIVLWSGSGDVQ